jgi:hypothetical protein
MLIQYFTRPSRIEELRNCPGGHLLEDFAKELAAVRYQWVAARQHIRTAEHFLHWIGHRNLSVTTSGELPRAEPVCSAVDRDRFGNTGLAFSKR